MINSASTEASFSAIAACVAKGALLLWRSIQNEHLGLTRSLADPKSHSETIAHFLYMVWLFFNQYSINHSEL